MKFAFPFRPLRRARRPRPGPAPSPRSGSALVIVLGMLAVLLLMAVAFSAFTRTERGGSTNLKNSQVARAAMQSAVSRVIEAIDLSFDSPTNNWPVACWPYPFLSSSAARADDYLQSECLFSNETSNAHVLTAEIAENLTPAQLALVRSSKCDWAPLYASINASVITYPDNGKDSAGSTYGDHGRPKGDSLVGRYAFVAIETTGLLDANIAGTYEGERAETSGEDPYAFNLPEIGDLSSAVLLDGDGNEVPKSRVRLSLKNAGGFRSARNQYGPFLSMADVQNLCGTATFDQSAPGNQTDYFPADLFSTYTPSLEEFDPTGHPKIVLPSEEKPFSGSKAGEHLKNFESRALRTMVGLFAQSRTDTSDKLTDKIDRDQYVFFERLGESSRLKLSRARIATVALLDALDDDILPGQHKTLGNYWTQLPSLTGDDAVPVAGKTVEDSIADIPDSYRQGRDSYLNFPVTDTSPVLVRAFSYVRLTNAVLHFASKPEDSSVEYRGVVHVGGIAANMNWAENAVGDDYTMTVDFDVLGGEPATRSVSGDPRETEVFEQLSYGSREGKKVTWKIGPEEVESGKKTIPGNSSVTSKPAHIASGKSDANDTRALYVHSTLPVTVTTKVDPDTIIKIGGSTDAYGNPIPGEEGYWSASVFPLSDPESKELYIPVRASFKITDSAGNIVQQVPAPALAKQDRSYWIRMSMGVPDNAACSGMASADKTSLYKPNAERKVPLNDRGGKPTVSKAPVDPDHAVPAELGWAACLAPAFGFDTSSLYCVGGDPVPPSYVGAWVNDVWARAAKGGNDDYDSAFQAMADKIRPDGDPENTDFISLGREVDLWGLHDILLNNVRFGRAFSKFVSPGISAVPDVMHASSRQKGSDGRLFNLGKRAADDSGGSIDATYVHRDLWSHIENGGMVSPGEMGSVMCGPFETLSLFQTYRFKPTDGHPVSDFHRVLDYFTVTEDRYPTVSDLSSATQSDGTVDWSQVKGSPLFSAVHAGRVNLNAPYLIRFSNAKKTRATDEDLVPNPFPLIAAIKGAACSATDSSKKLSGKAAGAIAASFLSSDHTRIESERWENCHRDMVFSIAGLGEADTHTDSNFTLETVIREADPQSDVDREAFLRNAANAVTTRGQSFLVIIRADAYSPMYGNEVAVGDGTTLATTHAIVELWRDPEPARYADGLLPEDAKERPLLFHNWYVRSFRVF